MKNFLRSSTLAFVLLLSGANGGKAEDLDGGECNKTFAESEGLVQMDAEKLRRTNTDMEDAGDSIPNGSIVWTGSINIEGDTFEVDYWNDQNGKCQMRMRLIQSEATV